VEDQAADVGQARAATLELDDAVAERRIQHALAVAHAEAVGDGVGAVAGEADFAGDLLALGLVGDFAADAHALAIDLELAAVDALESRREHPGDVLAPVGRRGNGLDLDAIDHALVA